MPTHDPPASPHGPVALPARDETTPLHGVQATRRLEARALAATPRPDLMDRAGRSAARLALAVGPHARRVWVACGPGHNGGDGLLAAAALAAGPREVYVTLDADVDRLPDDARRALARARATAVRFVDEPPPLAPHDLALDAWLGIGASRAPDGVLARRLAALNASPATRLALDLPSGLDPETGNRFGNLAFRADHTITFLTAKPGLFTAHGRDHAGRVWLDDLGVEHGEAPDAWLGPGCPAADPPRDHAGHKGRFGDVLAVGGARGMGGAVLLAARAAQAAGAGRVYVAPLDPALMAAGPLVHPALMWRRPPKADEAARWAEAVVVIGCGGGTQVAGCLGEALRGSLALVLDADALNAVAAEPPLQRQLSIRAGQGRGTVLTPHPLEAARLLGCTTETVQADRLSSAQAIADRFGAIVVLKGSGTVVAGSGVPPWINATGNASLATAGTGDVLAGWIAGRWAAQGGARLNGPACAALVQAAVLRHGWAVEAWGPRPARAEDLVEAMFARSTAPGG